MVADDDPAVRLLCEQSLGDAAGFEVASYADGTAILEAIDQRQPDIILLDVEMPGTDGFEACREIRSSQRSMGIPVVMITGNDDPESVNRAYTLGATDFVSKPIPWAVLPHRIRYVLRATRAFSTVQQSERRIRTMLQGIPDLMFLVDQNGVVLDDFLKEVPMQGSRADQFVGQPLETLMPPRIASKAREHLRVALGNGEMQTYEHSPDDGSQHFEVRLIPQAENNALIVIRDITDRKTSEARIHRLAYYDELTSLPNRQQFHKELQRAIENAKRNESMMAILYMDLDRFKRINDTLGHSVGDMLLKSVAKRLGSCVRPADYVARGQTSGASEVQLARLGGDEFILLIVDIDDEEEIAGIATRIRAALTEPFSDGGHQFVVTPSIGISLYPEDGSDIETLLMNADTAMYQAKVAGRNCHRFYTGTMNAKSLERLDLETDLRTAIENECFSLHYQPKVDMATWAVVGVEALLRWQHLERGWVSPGRFIPIAEETGLIGPLGEWVVRQACNQLKSWHGTEFDKLSIAVNVSSEQFRQDGLVDFVLKTVWQASIFPQRLELEITESLLMQDVERTIASLRSLKEAGIRLSIDDFGTGYSSLSYLRQFPLDSLKIDRSFIKDLNEDRDDAAICAAILAMARELNLTVVAEGVEQDDQVEFLRKHGCDQIQGFLYSKPLPLDQLEEFLATRLEYTQALGKALS
jgi:diguanylate cyclase (GGDEF)-like protein/PAS domain S-box-containing protein